MIIDYWNVDWDGKGIYSNQPSENGSKLRFDQQRWWYKMKKHGNIMGSNGVAP
jgi:hypothetical protein